MEKTTPQIDAILDKLSKLCCTAIAAGNTLDEDKCEELVRSLSANGWERHVGKQYSLSAILKERIVRDCPEPAMHRGAAIESFAQKVEQTYRDYARYRASTPDNEKPVAKDPTLQPQSPRKT